MLKLIALLCAIAGFTWFLITPLRSGLWRFPGPLWRRYADLFHALDIYNERCRLSIQQLHNRYGPVVQVGPRTLMFSDPAMIDQVYANRSPLPKSHHFRSFRHELKGVVFPNIVSTESTKDHAAIKRPIAGVYSMSNVTKSEGFIDECVLQLAHQLDKDYSRQGKPFNAFDWAHYFARDTIMKITASADFGLMSGQADREDMFRGVDAGQKFRAIGFSMPWAFALLKKSPLVQIFAKRMGSFPRRAGELIRNRRANEEATSKNNSREDLLSQFLKSREKHPDTVNELVLQGYAITPLFAGGDTVATAITSVIYFVCKHPSVATKLQAELQSCGLQMPPPWAAIRKMPYLDAVIRESLRCHPISAMINLRAIPPGRNFVLEDGRSVPSGTTVAVSGWTTHFNEEVYGSDVHDFRPERWLAEATESSDGYAARLRRMINADLTFGAGDRGCIGKNLARCELYKLMATLYSVFDIELVDPAKEWDIREIMIAKQDGVDATLSLRPDVNLDLLQRVGLS